MLSALLFLRCGCGLQLLCCRSAEALLFCCELSPSGLALLRCLCRHLALLFFLCCLIALPILLDHPIPFGSVPYMVVLWALTLGIFGGAMCIHHWAIAGTKDWNAVGDSLHHPAVLGVPIVGALH